MSDRARDNIRENGPNPWDAPAAEDEASDVAVPGVDPNLSADLHIGRKSAPTPARATRLVPAVEDDGPAGGGGWTIPLLCAGIALLACCILIPQADANRRLVYERQKLVMDLQSIQEQVQVNAEFLKKVADDPNLSERLAQRQMKIIRQGTRVLDLKQPGASEEMSPFHLVAVAPPPPMPPYKPLGGIIANLCYNPHSRLYLIGIGLGMMAAGLVLGYSNID